MSNNNEDLSLDTIRNIGDALSSAYEKVGNLSSSFMNLFSIISLISTLYGNISSGKEFKNINNNINDIAEKLDKVKQGLSISFGKQTSKMLSEFNDSAKELGNSLIDGTIVAINAKTSELIETMQEAIKETIDAAFKEADSHSPSKKMLKLGSYMAEGLSLGISDSSKEAISAAADMAKKVVDSTDGLKDASKAGEAYEDAMSDVIQGSKNLAKATKGSTDGLDDNFDKAKKSAKKLGDESQKTEKTMDKLGGKKIGFGGALAIAAGVLTAIVGLFKNLMDSNEGFREKVEAVWAKIKEIKGYSQIPVFISCFLSFLITIK